MPWTSGSCPLIQTYSNSGDPPRASCSGRVFDLISGASESPADSRRRPDLGGWSREARQRLYGALRAWWRVWPLMGG